MSFFGSPFGYGGMMPPAQSGGLDHYDPNEYKYRPPYLDPPKTPMDLYEKKEDRKTLGTIVSTILAGAAALIFIRHVQTLRAGEGFVTSIFSPHSREGLKEASRNLHRRLNTQQAKEWIHSIDKHTAFVKQMNSVKNKTPEQKIQRQESIEKLKTLLYDPKAGLGIERNDPVLKWDPPKGWGRLLPFGPSGFNWTLGRLPDRSFLHRYSQPGDVRTVIKAHKLLESSQVNKLQKKAPVSRNTSPFDSTDTLTGDIASSVSSSASTLRAPSLIPELTKGKPPSVIEAVLYTKTPLKEAHKNSIEGHFEARHTLTKKDKEELLKQIKKQKETFKKELEPFKSEKKHIDSIDNLTTAGDPSDRITNLGRIHEEATNRLKSLNNNGKLSKLKFVDNTDKAAKAHIDFYKNIQKSAKISDSDAENIKAMEAIKEHLKNLTKEEELINQKIDLSRSLRDVMKNEDK